MRMPDQPIPKAGDAVRLVNAVGWFASEVGKIAIIGGMADEDMRIETGRITFRASAFNDGRGVQCSGGPGSIGGLPTAHLRWTGETVRVRFWRWKDGHSGPHNGEDYWLDVPVWDWDGEQS